MKSALPWMMIAVAAVLICGSMPSGAARADGDRSDKHAEADRGDRDRDRDRGDELREPRIEGKAQDGPRDNERRGRRQPMTGQEIETARQIIATLYPELAGQMDALYEEDPDKLRRTIEKRFYRVRFLVKLRERDPAMFELRVSDIRLSREIDALAKQVRQAHLDDDKDAYKTHYSALEEKLTEHFDVKQRVRQAELELLRQRVEELETDLEDRADDRDDLIEHRLDELVGPEW